MENLLQNNPGQIDQDREIQRLRLELAEKDKTNQRLAEELERSHFSTTEQVRERVHDQIEKTLMEASQPVAMLATQAYLLEKQGKPVQARDILTVAKKLVRAVESLGLSVVGEVGETTSYNPNYHSVSTAAATINPGDQVRIQLVGTQFQGKILRKASVEKAGAA
jgi:molecular chaperone GrpE (heat shock protein)